MCQTDTNKSTREQCTAGQAGELGWCGTITDLLLRDIHMHFGHLTTGCLQAWPTHHRVAVRIACNGTMMLLLAHNQVGQKRGWMFWGCGCSSLPATGRRRGCAARPTVCRRCDRVCQSRALKSRGSPNTGWHPNCKLSLLSTLPVGPLS